jgi:hypothetical protein
VDETGEGDSHVEQDDDVDEKHAESTGELLFEFIEWLDEDDDDDVIALTAAIAAAAAIVAE